jgi:hypothetical protein
MVVHLDRRARADVHARTGRDLTVGNDTEAENDQIRVDRTAR